MDYEERDCEGKRRQEHHDGVTSIQFLMPLE